MKRQSIITSLLVAGIITSLVGTTVHAVTLEVKNGVQIDNKVKEEKVVEDKSPLDILGKTKENTEEVAEEPVEKEEGETPQEEEGTSQEEEATTGTLKLKAYYIPLDLKYNSPLFFLVNEGKWSETGDKVEIDADMTLELFNEDTADWESVEMANELKAGRYRVNAGMGFGNPVTESKEFIIKAGMNTTVDVEYTNFEVPTSFTVVATTEGLDVEGLTYIITADDATHGTKELRKGTVVDGKISTTLENEGKYQISFSDGTQTTQPVPFKILPDGSGTYSNNIRIYEFGKAPITDEDDTTDTDEQPSDDETDTGSGTTGKGNAPATSMMGNDFTPIIGSLLLAGSGAGLYIRRRKK